MANKESLLLTQEQEKFLLWLITPEDSREPSTKKAYAERNGIVVEAGANWKKQKPILERWKPAVTGLNQSPERSGKLLDVLYLKRLACDITSAELFLKATRQMPNAAQTLNIKSETALKELSDEDLQAMIIEIASKQKNPSITLEKL